VKILLEIKLEINWVHQLYGVLYAVQKLLRMKVAITKLARFANLNSVTFVKQHNLYKILITANVKTIDNNNYNISAHNYKISK
jgi:uncharacterized protein (UPF0276 family)